MTRHENNTKETYTEDIAQYLESLCDHKRLTNEEVIALYDRIRSGDKSARDELICKNQRLVFNVAKQHDYIKTMPLMDLIQYGNIGLIQAIDKFDPSLGNNFSNYASIWIYQRIQIELKRQTFIILPQCVLNIISVINSSTSKLDALGIDPTPEAIAEHIKSRNLNSMSKYEVTPEFVIKYQTELIKVNAMSLDLPINEGKESIIDSIIDDQLVDIEDQCESKFAISDVQETMLSVLTEREYQVICMRYGINGYLPMTLNDISKEFDVTRQRIRQIENKAMYKIKLAYKGEH